MSENNDKKGRLLRVSDVARRLKVSRARVHQYIEEGRLRVQRDPYSNWYLIDEQDLENLPLGRHWRREHGVEPGDTVHLLVAPRCIGVVKEVIEPDTLVVACPGTMHGMVHVNAWDVEHAEQGEQKR